MSRFFQRNFPETSTCIKPDKIDLSDCLACSGCITTSEKDKFLVDASFLKNRHYTYSFILSWQSKVNISRFYPELDYELFERALVAFLRKEFSVHTIVDTSYFRKQNETGISSECPAVVLYVERVFPTLIDQLSRVKSYQQMAAEWIRDRIVADNHRIVSVMQCYDKKDELRRDSTGIDHFLGTAEFYEFLKEKFVPEEYLIVDEINVWETTHKMEIQEISGIETSINHLNKAKTNGVTEFLELRICKSGCMNGPAQVRVDKETVISTVVINKEAGIFFDAGQRIFQKPKRRTFNVEW